MEIQALFGSRDKIVFNLEHGNCQVVAEGSCNLIEEVFRGLDVLHFKSSHFLSAQTLIGCIMGEAEGTNSMCGSVLSVSSLSLFSLKALTSSSILVSDQLRSLFNVDQELHLIIRLSFNL